ncbi:hypothetical protein PSECIP111951_03344 [Pseudoalteromonas holothuriae]|uniref:Uncharacterized protein n=1 Tax=Pseudoalteromonas holothuriae TaxID=2963714 RepID=A0A9W4W6P9_9GAMM|nr:MULTISPECIES: hypothetical protein [unclassified Pseudoalteromonas]CAH9064407.1 hypothetical protein PSECIP111854_03440 [Pseudoalteromonas sp. CIP111854]CAH9065364.1 hypothetical protein PSECIP111951_03344 [Pseudoalteromonas sp. CIP111951]
MTYSFSFSSKGAISLATFIERVKLKYHGLESLHEHQLHYFALQLQLLANNKYFLTELVSERVLKDALQVDIGSKYGNDSLVVYVNKSPFFQVRACFWHPEGEYQHQNDKLNVYRCLHDHNFAFLTTNYYGPGYTSRFYHYDYADKLEAGCDANLAFNGAHPLRRGEVIYYEPSKDAHLQVAPKAFSISLNLMFETNGNKQFVFNAANGRIVQTVTSSNDVAKQFIKELTSAV